MLNCTNDFERIIKKDFASFSASKSALSALSEALEIEWYKYDIAVKEVLPSLLESPLLQEQKKPAKVLQHLRAQLTPEQVAQGVYRCVYENKRQQMMSKAELLFWRAVNLVPTPVLRHVMIKLSGR